MIGVFTPTLLAPLNGFVLITDGATTSGPVPVVNVVVCDAATFPAKSVTPVMVSVITVLSGKGACGTTTTLWLLLLKLIESATAVVPPPVNWMLPAFTVNALIGSLNTTLTCALSPTFTDPLGGDTDTIAGATVSVPVPVSKNTGSCVNGKANPFVPCNPLLICTK